MQDKFKFLDTSFQAISHIISPRSITNNKYIIIFNLYIFMITIFYLFLINNLTNNKFILFLFKKFSNIEKKISQITTANRKC